jgi:hypothetical protein
LGVCSGANKLLTIKKTRYAASQTLVDSFKQPKQRKMDMKFGTWSAKSLYSQCIYAARELPKCKLHLMGVQQDRWDGAILLYSYYKC